MKKYYRIVVELDKNQSLGESKKDIMVNMLYRYIAFSEMPETVTWTLSQVLNINSFEELDEWEKKNPVSAYTINALRDFHSINMDNPPDELKDIEDLRSQITAEIEFQMFKTLVNEFYGKASNMEILKKNIYRGDAPKARILEIEEETDSKYADGTNEPSPPDNTVVLSKLLESHFDKVDKVTRPDNLMSIEEVKE